MLDILKRFFSSKGEKKKDADVKLSVQGDVNLSITQNIYTSSEGSTEVSTHTLVPNSQALRKARKLDDSLLELVLNYVITEGANGVSIYRVQEEKGVINAYLFVIKNRVYAYIDTLASQLQPGVRTGGVVKANVQFAIITSHSVSAVVEDPAIILTGITSGRDSIVQLTEDEIVHAKKVLLVG